MRDEGYHEDIIEMREDEKIDAHKVAEFLQGKLPGSEQPLHIRQFGGGAANLTYLLDYGTHEYVLRRPPLGPVAATAHDMEREYRVLSVLYQSFPLAPRSYLYHEDPEIVGAPFHIMERRSGIVVRREMPEAYEGIEDAPARMSKRLIESMAQFHAVDYDAIGLADLGEPVGFIARQVQGWHRRWEKAKTEEVPAMESVYEWLRANQPQTTSYSLVHNDYKLDNVILAPEDPGRLVAILDWDMCTLGDPLSDLGALLGYWSEPDDPVYAQALAMMPTGELGFMSRAELVRRYAEVSGRSVASIDFYYVLSLFRIAVIVAQIYIRYVRGQTQDERFAVFGQVIPLFARAAEDVAQGKIRLEV